MLEQAMAATLPDGETTTRPQFCRPLMSTVQATESVEGEMPTKRPSPSMP